MFKFARKSTVLVAVSCAMAAASHLALASGMVPETTVVLINEEDGQSSINVTNSDTVPALLLASLHDLPEDPEQLLIVTPPVARLEAGQVQQVRVMLQAMHPLKTQRLKRIYFEGVPQKQALAGGQGRFAMTVRQNLPVIINPKGLAGNDEPWKLLKWRADGARLEVANDSAYVVRLAQSIELEPAKTVLNLPKTYILPGEHLAISIPANSAATAVRLFPATLYGYAAAPYDAALTRKAANAPAS